MHLQKKNNIYTQIIQKDNQFNNTAHILPISSFPQCKMYTLHIYKKRGLYVIIMSCISYSKYIIALAVY